MLYDPRWNRKIEAKPDKFFQGVSLRGLIAWLETKPANGEYDYGLPLGCALAQYKQAIGYKEEQCLVDFFTGSPKGDWLHDIVAYEETFGGALTRARAALAEMTPNASEN